MNLVYLWIEDKNNENNIGFNFGGKYRFLFKQKQDEKTGAWTNTLEISENPNYIENFYGFNNKEMKNCISSVTCCVGKNGAGKTTLLEKVTNIVASKALINQINKLQVCVWHDIRNNKWYVGNSENIIIKYKILDSDFQLRQIEIEEWDNLLGRYKGIVNNKLDVILYSNYFDETSNPDVSSNDWNGLYDIRTNSAIHYYCRELFEKYNIDNIDKVNAYNIQEMNNKIDFYFKISDKKDFKEIEKQINGDKSFIRENMKIKPQNLSYEIYKKRCIENWKLKKDDNEIINLLDEIEKHIQKNIRIYEKKVNSSKRNTEDAGIYLEWIYCHSFWLIILDYYSKLYNIIKPDNKLFKDYKKNCLSIINNPYSLLLETEKLITENAKQSTGSSEIVSDIKDIVLMNFNSFLKLLKEFSAKKENNSNPFQQPDTVFVNIADCYQEIKKLLEFYHNSVNILIPAKYVNFCWSPKLSSGENAFLTLLSRLYKVFNDISSETENVLLLIDEAELGFHPQWQKQYISILILYLNYLLKIVDKDYINIQLIFTTNSPIPLSDILPNDIIYLDGHKPISNSSHKSFGSDLYTLYCDTFFINDGLIGNFAKYKINEMIEELQSDLDENKISYFKKLINNIGDQLIQNHLKKRLKNKVVNSNYD